MAWLDMRTVMVSHLITDFLGFVVIFFLWRQNRERYPGPAWWTVGFGLQFLGTLLIVARGAVPEWISIVFGNIFIVAGIATTIEGVRRFGGRSRSRLPTAVLLAVLAAALFFFSQVRADLSARTLAVTGALGLLFIDGAIAGFRRFTAASRRIAARIGLGFVLLALFSAVRLIAILADPPRDQDFFQAGAFESLFLLAYQTLFIFMTYTLALMINERLIGEIGFQEEKFSKAFFSAPYGISLTDAKTGRIIDLNDGFIESLGYSREEVLGKTTIELRVWEDDEDRRRQVAALAASGKVRDLEVRFRKRSGEMMTALWSAEMIEINGVPCVFSSLKDISSRKKVQEGLRVSIRQKELLMRELRLRVKNSLNIVSGLLGLNLEASADSRVKSVLSDLRTRIRSVSSVYDQLDWAGRIDTIRLKDYIRHLTEFLALSYAPKDKRVRISTRLEDLALETKRALPLGLILNELIINSFKYAFPEGASGEIRVELTALADRKRLTVSDNGVGKIEGRKTGEGSGIGGTLVDMLAGQIGAEIRRLSGPGTTFEIDF